MPILLDSGVVSLRCSLDGKTQEEAETGEAPRHSHWKVKEPWLHSKPWKTLTRSANQDFLRESNTSYRVEEVLSRMSTNQESTPHKVLKIHNTRGCRLDTSPVQHSQQYEQWMLKSDLLHGTKIEHCTGKQYPKNNDAIIFWGKTLSSQLSTGAQSNALTRQTTSEAGCKACRSVRCSLLASSKRERIPHQTLTSWNMSLEFDWRLSVIVQFKDEINCNCEQ